MWTKLFSRIGFLSYKWELYDKIGKTNDFVEDTVFCKAGVGLKYPEEIQCVP